MKVNPMKNMSLHWLLALCLVLLAGCAPSASDMGSAQFAVSVPQALASSISRVSVTAIAADFPSFSVELVSTNGTWGGTLASIPAGSNRSFLAQAFDASGTKLFEGSVSGVSIVADQPALVALSLQQVNAPPPFLNEAPVLDSLVASSTSTSVTAGSSLSLVATAHDPNAGDTLSYAWSATAGSFSAPSAASTSWTAPASTGIQTLTLTLTDSKGLSFSVSLAVNVTPSPVLGTAQLSLSFNNFPQVTSLSASLPRLAVGQTTSVSASVSDLDADSLSYSWSASCAGSFANASSTSAQFTPSALPAGLCNNCRVTVSVSDGRGGQGTGTLALCVTKAPAPQHFNPFITSAAGSSGIASSFQVLTYDVAASDIEGSALSFSWTANTGVLGTVANSASASHITWTAPPCLLANTIPRITVTVTNAFNLTATQNFAVTGLPTCPGAWASTGPMTSVRADHTATLLNNGKVLVAGGQGNTAEVYDPASGTWSATGPMVSPRYGHTATLLNNGKVLVTGGQGSSGYLATTEVYDPASSTWSAAASLAEPRYYHTATLLNNGKVLIAGGTASKGYLAATEVYDPALDTWSAAASMTEPRFWHAATLLNNGKVLVTGGFSRNYSTAEVYDPALGTWSATGTMASARYIHTATLLQNGKVLVAGGITNSSPFAPAEVYDPALGTWSTTGPMAPACSNTTATLLPNGRVLISGGQGSSGNIATTEEYDPASNTWSFTASMALARAHHTATPLPNGKVLVAGTNGGSSIKTAELYTPGAP
jgi:hypothetical protein